MSARRLLLLGGGRQRVVDDFAALSPRWAVLRGTPSVAGGALRADTLEDDGHNLLPNPGFEGTYVAGLAPNTALYSSVTPSEETVDVYAGLSSQRYVTATGNQGVSQPVAALVPLTTYHVGFYGKATSPAKFRYGLYNTVEYSWDGDTTGTGAWQHISKVQTVKEGYTISPLYLSSAAPGDYLVDEAHVYRRSFLALARAAPHMCLRANVTAPASGVCPLHIVFRANDGLTYSMVRLVPATAGNDTHIIERVAGVETTRASADVDYAHSTSYDIGIDAFGSNVVVSVNGVARTSYNAAIGQTYPYVGGEMLDSAADKWTINSISVEW